MQAPPAGCRYYEQACLYCDHNVHLFLSAGALKQAYYRKLVDAGKLDPDAAWSDIVFASKPASGGAILRLNM